MPDKEVITDAPLPGEKPDGGAAGSEEGEKANLDAISLADLNATLGKNFTSKEAALKSLKDTQSFVGKKVEPAPATQQFDASQFVSKAEFEENLFFANNKEYDTPEARTLLKGLRGEGQSLNEVANSDGFKSVYGKIKVADDLAKSKTVLEPNSRMGKATTKIGEAEELASKGNTAGAAKSAVGAVLEAYDL